MRATGNTWTEIELSQKEVDRLTLQNIQNQIKKTGYDWNVYSYYIRDGMVCEDEEFSGSHRWTEIQEIRPANKTDHLYFEFIGRLKSMMSSV
jgi:hypothetical protein